MEAIRAKGLDIMYECAGQGPPLVFVHGAAEDGRVWRSQVAELSDEFTVIAWDEPGAGRSSDVPANFTLDDYADCLAELIDTLALGPACVAGISWGGTLVLNHYRRHHHQVQALILADTYAGWKGSLPAEEVRARVDITHAMLTADVFDPSFAGVFAGDPPAGFADLLDAVAADVRPESMRTALSQMAVADLRGVLPEIEVPTLLIWGELDARSPLGIAHEFQRAINGAQLVVIPCSGHASHMERPDEFNAAVRSFCRANA